MQFRAFRAGQMTSSVFSNMDLCGRIIEWFLYGLGSGLLRKTGAGGLFWEALERLFVDMRSRFKGQFRAISCNFVRFVRWHLGDTCGPEIPIGIHLS